MFNFPKKGLKDSKKKAIIEKKLGKFEKKERSAHEKAEDGKGGCDGKGGMVKNIGKVVGRIGSSIASAPSELAKGIRSGAEDSHIRNAFLGGGTTRGVGRVAGTIADRVISVPSELAKGIRSGAEYSRLRRVIDRASAKAQKK
jgi:hypothetical protein